MFYVADVEVNWNLSHDALTVFLLKNNLLVFFPMRGERHHRIVGTFPEEFAKDEGAILYNEIEERIKRDAEIELDITNVNWFSTYKVHTRHVNRFSAGRCFLAGDAAHIHTPAGAQGMNTGIQDGYNLAWKLALVLKGKVSEKLLETYNQERLENAENLLKTTDRLFNFVASPDAFLAYFRTRVFPYVAGAAFNFDAVRKFIFPRISQIGVNYRSSSLSEMQGNFSVRAGDRMPYFTVDGKSIYDRLHQPKFHLLVYSNDEIDFQDLENKIGKDSVDFSLALLSPEVKEIFGTEKPFIILLRPDNYIGLISVEISLVKVKNYLEQL